MRGKGLRYPGQWSRGEAFESKSLGDPQAKQVLERAHVTFSDGDRIIDPLQVPAIPDRPGYEDGRLYELPSEVKNGDDSFTLTQQPQAGLLTLRVAFDPFTRRDPSHAIDFKGRNGLIIASYRVSELPIRNRAGADFIYGTLVAPVLEDHGLKTNERVHLVANPMTDAILEWVSSCIDDLSNELYKEENAKEARPGRERESSAFEPVKQVEEQVPPLSRVVLISVERVMAPAKVALTAEARAAQASFMRKRADLAEEAVVGAPGRAVADLRRVAEVPVTRRSASLAFPKSEFRATTPTRIPAMCFRFILASPWCTSVPTTSTRICGGSTLSGRSPSASFRRMALRAHGGVTTSSADLSRKFRRMTLAIRWTALLTSPSTSGSCLEPFRTQPPLTCQTFYSLRMPIDQRPFVCDLGAVALSRHAA